MGTGSVVNLPVDLLAVLVIPVDAITSSVDATCDMAVRFGALRYEGDNVYVNQIVSAMVGCFHFLSLFFLVVGRRLSVYPILRLVLENTWRVCFSFQTLF
jgi:hypothetical protein